MSQTDEPNEAEHPAAPTTMDQWRAYLQEYDRKYLQTTASDEEIGDLLEPEEIHLLAEGHLPERWLGEDPASEENVAACEARLGTQLPPSFRSFLLASNGLMRVGGWTDELHPCERISWMRDCSSGESLIPLYSKDPVHEEYVQVFRRGLEISTGEDYWILDPGQVGPDGEWAAYLFQPKYGDLDKSPNFFALLHESYVCME